MQTGEDKMKEAIKFWAGVFVLGALTGVAGVTYLIITAVKAAVKFFGGV